MRLLLDTNIVIPAEPTSPEDLEPSTPAVADLLSLVSQGGHTALVHPSSVRELQGDSNSQRVVMRTVLLRKYPWLDPAPPISTRLVAVLGTPREGSNSHVDLILLSALEGNAVEYFVTEDDGIHRRAKRANLGDRVLTVADAIATLRALFPTVPEAPPLVAAKLAYELNEQDPIFQSFRADYSDFDQWFAKCKREHRQSWIIQAGLNYRGICIVKEEVPREYGIFGKTLKVCSFKIADDFRGHRYGELLLKALFGYLVENRYEAAFVEVFAKQQQLVALFADFGFEDIAESPKGERVLRKHLRPRDPERIRLGPLDYNIKYGPHALTLSAARVFVVPIQPRYHALLFPELEEQLALATESNPFGNSIRKAYLCHSKIQKVAAGDILLFYRSEKQQAVAAIGVAEATMRATDAVAIARFVGKRTVYPFSEIEKMATKPVFAVLFRLARTLKTPWSVDLLKSTGIIKRAPQSFMEVQREVHPWIAEQLNAPR